MKKQLKLYINSYQNKDISKKRTEENTLKLKTKKLSVIVVNLGMGRIPSFSNYLQFGYIKNCKIKE